LLDIATLHVPPLVATVELVQPTQDAKIEFASGVAVSWTDGIVVPVVMTVEHVPVPVEPIAVLAVQSMPPAVVTEPIPPAEDIALTVSV
jgi:hypothetical protein